MRALIVADGDLPSRAALDAAWPGWDDRAELVAGADGGFLKARAIGLRPSIFVGDGDSLPPGELERLRAEHVELELSPAAKDESDTELAVLSAVRRGATSIAILGALGGRRVDHELANVGLLAMTALDGCRVELLDAVSRLSLLVAPARDGSPVYRPLPGRVGDLVSLLPIGGDVAGITTAGLAYPLRDEPLRLGPARGLSNVRLNPDAALTVRSGRLLVIESHPVEDADPGPDRQPAAEAGLSIETPAAAKGVEP